MGGNPELERLAAAVNDLTIPNLRLPAVPAMPVIEPRSVLQDCLVYDTIPVTEDDRALVAAVIARNTLAQKGDRATRPDARPRKESRENRKRYKKAHAYYGKTYIVTQAQMMCAVSVCVGMVLVLAGLLFSWYLHVYEQANSLVG